MPTGNCVMPDSAEAGGRHRRVTQQRAVPDPRGGREAPAPWGRIGRCPAVPGGVLRPTRVAGAAVDTRAKYGEKTPLHLAAQYGTPENIIALIKAGADASLTDKGGKTPFDHAGDNDKLKGSDAYRQLRDAR